MDSDHLVSIVIPCYQQQAFLERALLSIQNQSHKNIEVLVVDDGSSPAISLDETSWPFPMQLIRQNNQGLSSARNTGLHQSRGKWIKFLDCDDELLPNCIEDQLNNLSDLEDSISVIGFIETSEASDKQDTIIPAFAHPEEAALLINFGPPHIYLYPRQRVLDMSGFDTSERVNGGHEDYDLILKLCAAKLNFISVHKPGVIYYRRDGSMSTNTDKMARTRAAVWCYRFPSLLEAYKHSPGFLSSSLVALCRLLEVTPQQYHFHFLPIFPLLVQQLRQNGLHIPVAELDLIVPWLEKISGPEAQSLLQLTRALLNKQQNQPLTWSPQNIIDRRLVLATQANPASMSDWLLSILPSAYKSNKQFAIYGAGELGIKTMEFLRAMDLQPACFIDRRAAEIREINSIKVETLDTLSTSNVNLVIIASHAYRDEIIQDLRRHSPHLTMV